MTLPTSQVDLFYAIWRSLLGFANERLNVVPSLSGKGPKDKIISELAIKVRNALWQNASLLDEFVSQNPARLSEEALGIVQTWKYRLPGTFIVYKTLKKHVIFLSQDHSGDVYAVKGLYSSFEELFGMYLPIMIKTVLIPFQDEITTDGLFESFSVIFGPGIRSEFKDLYNDARERGDIITTLLRPSGPTSHAAQVAKAEATNLKTLDAFQKHQNKFGLSPKTVERDLVAANHFSQYLLSRQPEATSLRNFQAEMLFSYLTALPAKERKPATLSLRRYLSFLLDTGRLKWEEAQTMIEKLSER
jgi:hypothetical protein